MEVIGYKKKTKSELLKAVDKCQSISQLCALVQHEGIVIRMQCHTLASNLPVKQLSTGESIKKSPLDNLKDRVKNSIHQTR
ncbi:MAG: hypothetical protein IJD68_00880 [Ruminococcus sp.]|nr:hypothetical protein [Ruminococcus sp.]